ncbi:MAG: hypothetical protein SGI86_12025 [Deltaproteobacteria bacterium]|nr:hypothetical protein [Deltaproteobacteria bacterium]
MDPLTFEPEKTVPSLRLEWALIGLSVILAIPIFFYTRGTPMRIGTRVRSTISLITIDRYEIWCAAKKSIGDLRCAYEEPGKPVTPPPPYAKTLVAYVTAHGQLLYMPGLFDEPAIAARLAKEPPKNIPKEKLRRFDAHCDIEVIGRLRAQPRFGREGGFGEPQSAWVARAHKCTVER